MPVLALQACVSLTPEQERYYGFYVGDTDAPPLDPPRKTKALAVVMSVLIPGLGYFYLGEPGWGVAWLFLGCVTGVIGGAVATAIDTDTVNRGLLADEYKLVYDAREGRRKQEVRRAERAAQPGKQTHEEPSRRPR